MDRFALFPTPLFVYDVPNVEHMNRELAERLRSEAQASPGVRRANVGGWHSPPDLAFRSDACYRATMKMIVDHVSATHANHRCHGACAVASLALRRAGVGDGHAQRRLHDRARPRRSALVDFLLYRF